MLKFSAALPSGTLCPGHWSTQTSSSLWWFIVFLLCHSFTFLFTKTFFFFFFSFSPKASLRAMVSTETLDSVFIPVTFDIVDVIYVSIKINRKKKKSRFYVKLLSPAVLVSCVKFSLFWYTAVIWELTFVCFYLNLANSLFKVIFS